MKQNPQPSVAPAPGRATSAGEAFLYTFRTPQLWLLVALIVVIAGLAQAIGPAEISLGPASITMLPMIWGLILAAVLSAQKLKPMPAGLQHAAGLIMGVAVLLLCARLSLTMGPNIPLILEAGPALLLQEFGNVFGTILLALPLAVLLRMGPATVGATFSVDREAAFAMVTNRFGSDSPQYRGVLSMYVFGSVFGAVIATLIASLATSLGIFDPLALAMGSGIGSGSMMAAGASAVAAAHPEMQDQILALATTANLIASLAGIYLGVWVSLPVADRFYRLLTRNRDAEATGRKSIGTMATEQLHAVKDAMTQGPEVRVPLWNILAILCGAGLVVAVIAERSFTWDMVWTYLLLAALVAVSMGVTRISRGKVPALIVLVTLGMLVSSPISPVAGWVAEASESVDFLSVITMMLTVAGLSLGKDMPMLRSIGWKIVPVGVVGIAATFVCSTIIAEFVLGLVG
ncbi:DUF3100 domain-containing protein [Rothia halotolerans]|uniref:DUF3100 domain-containing protein n=1 Tax=Rothia halotolerans TaxID=405770 RepID=UPI00101B7EA1|nr:DUF3100 domain-containing protein [Rothia halotolerans]